jgi:hypothetical protein
VQRPVVIGIDPSFTKSGISDGKTTELIVTKPSDDENALADTIRRAQFIATECRLFTLRTNGPGPTKFYIEAPMVGPTANHLYEVGVLMAELARELDIENIVLVTPKTLKKHMTGDGGSPKKHAQCRKVNAKTGKIGPPCVVCGVQELHGISFEKDAGADKLHAWGLWSFGTAVESGKIAFTPPARRGKGKVKVAHRKAVAKKKEKLDKPNNRISRKANAS